MLWSIYDALCFAPSDKLIQLSNATQISSTAHSRVSRVEWDGRPAVVKVRWQAGGRAGGAIVEGKIQ